MTPALAYLIIRADVVERLQSGSLAACWALQSGRILDVAGDAADAARAGQEAARRLGEPVSLLAVMEGETIKPEL